MPHLPSVPNAAGFVALLEWLGNQARAGTVISLGDAIDHAGSRIHGAAILLLAFPDSIPLPIPSVGAILGVPLMFISAHLAIFGEKGDLPLRARQMRLPNRMIATIEKYLVGTLRRAEGFSHLRLSVLARRERLIGVVCLLMSLLLLLPIPLMNVPPAMAMVFMSWGLVQRDGLIVGIGMSIAAAVVAILILFAELTLGALAA